MNERLISVIFIIFVLPCAEVSYFLFPLIEFLFPKLSPKDNHNIGFLIGTLSYIAIIVLLILFVL